MKPEEEIEKGLVEPDSSAGSFPTVQTTGPEPFQVSRKELQRRWMRYRRLHRYRIPIIPLPQPGIRSSLHQPGIRSSLHQPGIHYPQLLSRRTPHA